MKVIEPNKLLVLSLLALSALFLPSPLSGQNDIEMQLLDAVIEGDISKAGELIDQGAKLKDFIEGQPILFWATEQRDLEMMEFLVSRGADINQKNEAGQTPLVYCLRWDHPELVAFFLKKGADSSVKGKSTLLHQVAMDEENDLPEIAGLLIEYGADINAKDKQKQTPLQRAVFYSNLETALVIAEYGPSLDFTFVDVAPLPWVLYFDVSDELAATFVMFGADFNNANEVEGEDFLPPFEYAARNGMYRTVGAMLQMGADPGIQIDNLPLLGFILETEEISEMNDTLLRDLIIQGASVDVVYKEKNLASHLILEDLSYELDTTVFAYCKKEELGQDAAHHLLLEATTESDVKTVQLILSMGHSIIPEAECLARAIWNCNYEILEMLIESGANVNEKDEWYGHTPFHELVSMVAELGIGDEKYGFVRPDFFPHINLQEAWEFPEKASRLLIKYGADINAKDDDGKTPLAYSKEFSRKPLFELFIELGAVE